MHKINCTVNDCSFNNGFLCVADKVNIGGVGASDEKHTCCGTFLDKAHYSDLSSSINSKSDLSEISCKVNTCSYNEGCNCGLDTIQVSGLDETKLYTETNCSSFKAK